MTQRSRGYWILIACGIVLLIIQLIATMGAHGIATRRVHHESVASRLLEDILIAKIRAKTCLSSSTGQRDANKIWARIDSAETRLSILIAGGSARVIPISDEKGRQLTRKIQSELKALRNWLDGHLKQSALPYVWDGSGDEAFTGTIDATESLVTHVQVGILSNAQLHERLEITMLILIAAVILSGIAIIYRNDRVQRMLLKKIASDEKGLRTTMNSITDGVIAMDSDGCITRMNTVAEQLTGRTIEDARGLEMEMVFRLHENKDRKRLSTEIREVVAAEKAVSPPKSGQLESHKGETHPIEYRTSTIYDEASLPVGAVLVFRKVDNEMELRRQLEEKEFRYRAIVDSSPIGMYVYELMDDDRLVMRAANPAASELVGAEQSRNVGMTIEEAFPPLKETDIPDAYRRVAKTGEVWQDDQLVYEDTDISGAFEVRAFRIAPNWMVAAFSNVTERKRAEAELAKSEAKFRNLFETMEQGVVYQDPDGQFLHANLAALTLLGLTEGELHEMSFTSPRWQAIDEDGAPVSKNGGPGLRAMATKRPVKDFLMGVLNQSDKSYRWLNISATPEFRPDESEPYQVYTTFHDITERKNAATEVQRLQTLLASIINSMPSVMIGIDTECRVTHWNRQAETVTGVALDTAIGRRPDELHPPFQHYVDKARHAIANRETVEESHVMPQDPRNVRHEEVTIYPLGHPVVTGAVIRVDDVTEQRHLVEQLRQSQKMDAVGQLAGGVAHDFNNMLAGILGAAELLQDNVDGQNRQFVDMIVESAERAADLTRKLLSFSRKGRVESHALDIHEAINSSIALLKHTLDKRVEIKTRFDAPTSTITGDSTQLQNAFINMGINAGHAMPDGGILTFATQVATLSEQDCSASAFVLTPGNYLQINVQDTGCGMPIDVAERIFEPFFTTRPVGAGTGLGLSAVYGAVQQHHGAISVHSERSKGTTFEILLPLSGMKRHATQEEVPHDKVMGTVLLVDDEAVIRQTTKAILEAFGFNVILAANGMDAIHQYERGGGSIDVVLLDMLMPKVDGKGTFAALKKLDPSVRVILSSGFASDTDVDKMLKDGLAGFITKPYNAKDLMNTIAKAIRADSPVG